MLTNEERGTSISMFLLAHGVAEVFLSHCWVMLCPNRCEAQKDAIHPTPVFELLGLALEEFVDKVVGYDVFWCFFMGSDDVA